MFPEAPVSKMIDSSHEQKIGGYIHALTTSRGLSVYAWYITDFKEFSSKDISWTPHNPAFPNIFDHSSHCVCYNHQHHGMSVLLITLREILGSDVALSISFTAATVGKVLRPYQAPGPCVFFRWCFTFILHFC